MTPAAFTQTDLVRDIFATARRDDTFRSLRTPRRFSATFVASDAQTPLFHAWRP